MTSTEEALELLADAHDTIRHAEQTSGIGIYRVAVSLAYYAAFYAARAVVAYHRESPKTHEGVRTRFHFLVVARSDFPPDVAPIVDKLADDRLRADYDHAAMRGWQEADATTAIEQARTFVNEVDGWFRRHPPTGRRSSTVGPRARRSSMTGASGEEEMLKVGFRPYV